MHFQIGSLLGKWSPRVDGKLKHSLPIQRGRDLKLPHNIETIIIILAGVLNEVEP